MNRRHAQSIEVMNDPEAPWVVLMHGYGADAADLSALADMFPTKSTFNYLFPQGIFEVPIGPGWTGRAWWPLDLEKLQNDIAAGKDRDTGLEQPPQLAKTRDHMLKILRDLRVPFSKIILGGFSQGAMLTTDLAMHLDSPVGGLVLMSGAPVNKAEWLSLPQKDIEFFQSHGDADTVLSHKNAQRLESVLRQKGLRGKLVSFHGGHEIPPSVIQQIGDFLDRMAARMPSSISK